MITNYGIANSPLNCLDTIPNTDFVIAAGDDITLINTNSNHTHQLPRPHYSPTKSLHTLNSQLISSNLHIINHWDLTKGEVIKSIPIGGKEHINDLKFINESLVVTGGNNCHMTLFDMRSYKQVYNLKVSKDNINTIHHHNHTVYITSNDKTMVSVDLRNEQLITRTFNDPIINFQLLDDSLLLNLLQGGDLEVLNLSTNEIVNKYSVMNNPLTYVMKFDYCHSDSLVAIGTETGQIDQYGYNRLNNMLVPKSSYNIENGGIINNVKYKNGSIIGTSNKGVVYKWCE